MDCVYKGDIPLSIGRTRILVVFGVVVIRSPVKIGHFSGGFFVLLYFSYRKLSVTLTLLP